MLETVYVVPTMPPESLTVVVVFVLELVTVVIAPVPVGVTAQTLDAMVSVPSSADQSNRKSSVAPGSLIAGIIIFSESVTTQFLSSTLTDQDLADGDTSHSLSTISTSHERTTLAVNQ